ncbi:MAG: hypothetical protein V3U37_04375 [Nitrospinaceae bacterium]
MNFFTSKASESAPEKIKIAAISKNSPLRESDLLSLNLKIDPIIEKSGTLP